MQVVLDDRGRDPRVAGRARRRMSLSATAMPLVKLFLNHGELSGFKGRDTRANQSERPLNVVRLRPAFAAFRGLARCPSKFNSGRDNPPRIYQ